MNKNKIGLPPGSLIYTGDKSSSFQINVIKYSENSFSEEEIHTPEELANKINTDKVTWINITGLYNVEMITKICNLFKIHPLIIEDILNVHHRPKMEDLEEYLFIIAKEISFIKESNTIISSQISIILKENIIITFTEEPSKLIESLIKRIKQNKGVIRKHDANYLLYALMDIIVDNYFLVLELIDEKVDFIENYILESATNETVRQIHELKRNLIDLRKTIWPLREIMGTLYKDDFQFSREITIYFRDVYDHTIQVIDTLETLKDRVNGLVDIYYTVISTKMNEVMKVLTIIATIFIPLTLITGIYGMNFEYMPELKWRYGYFIVLAVMFFIAILMLLYFRKKKWL